MVTPSSSNGIAEKSTTLAFHFIQSNEISDIKRKRNHILFISDYHRMTSYYLVNYKKSLLIRRTYTFL
jgi:hypothetical protein